MPSYSILENDYLLAILDVEPYSQGHTLILPKKHSEKFEELDDETLLAIGKAIKEISHALTEMFHYDGIVLLASSGSKLQDIPHLHFHVYGKMKGKTNTYYKQFKDAEEKDLSLKQTSEKIATFLANQSHSDLSR